MKEIIAENKSRIKAIIKKLTGSYNEDIEQEVYIKTWKIWTVIRKKASLSNGSAL